MLRISTTGLCAALFLTAVVSRAAEPRGGAGIGSRGEEWLGEGSDLGLELAHVIAAGKRGATGQARRDLERIAAEAEARGLKEVWIRAQQAWVRFTLVELPESDLSPAVEELLTKARAWELGSEEAEIFALWSEVLQGQGQWLMALKAQDRTTQLALDAGRVTRAVEAFLEMARLCRGAGHGWRLRQVWVRLDQVLAERPVELPEGLRARLAEERTAGTFLLSQTGNAGAATAGGASPAGVDLQPKESRVLVSSPDRELGRSRFLLTNASSFPVEGTLSLTAGGAAVTSWQGGENGIFITLGRGQNAGAGAGTGGIAEGGAGAGGLAGTGNSVARAVRLRAGQQLEVYVEHDPAAAQDTVRVKWEGGGGGGAAPAATEASGTFYFADGLPSASVVNAGVFQLHAGWCIPLYHEIYHRGRRTLVQNLQVTASAPCRLEIYDHDTGRLLAVDADGDGSYQNQGDQVLEDADRDGWPDLVIADRARAIEICAWPAGGTGAGITVSAGLRRGSGNGHGGGNGNAGRVSGAVENTVRAAAPAAGRP